MTKEGETRDKPLAYRYGAIDLDVVLENEYSLPADDIYSERSAATALNRGYDYG